MQNNLDYERLPRLCVDYQNQVNILQNYVRITEITKFLKFYSENNLKIRGIT